MHHRIGLHGLVRCGPPIHVSTHGQQVWAQDALFLPEALCFHYRSRPATPTADAMAIRVPSCGGVPAGRTP